MSGGTAAAGTVAAGAAAAGAATAATAATATTIGGFTLAEIGGAASLASAAIGAIGAIQQGQAAKASGNYNARVAQNNSDIAKQNATLAGREGAANAERQEMTTRAGVGAIEAAQSANGVDVNSGSAVDVRSGAAQTGMLNAITVRSNAARQAYGSQTQAASDIGQSQLDTAQASNASTAGDIGAGSTLLSGGAKGAQTGTWDALLNSKSINGDVLSGSSGDDTLI